MFRKIRPYMGGYIRYTYAALVTMFAGLIASAVPFFIVYRIIKPLLDGETLDAGYYITHIVIIFACELAYAILYVLGLKFSHITAYNTLKNIRISLQKKLERQPLGTIQDMGNGRIKKLFTDDIDQVELLLAHAIPEGVSNLAMALIAIVCMFFADWKLALLSLCSLPLGMLAMGMMFKAGMARMNAYYTASAKMNATIMFFSYEKRRKKELAADPDKCTLRVPELDIPCGSVTALTGKNGAGKSTFLRCLCGLEKSCTVKLDIGGSVYSSKKLLKICYMVMQDVDHQLFTDSVTAEVCLSMKDEDTAKCDGILESLGLLAFKDKHPMALSGGQKQRVAIASALAADAELLLFDEPTSGLDYAHMTSVAKLLKQLSAQGRTVIVSTHDPELIALCCDYVLCLEHGRVKYFGDV